MLWRFCAQNRADFVRPLIFNNTTTPLRPSDNHQGPIYNGSGVSIIRTRRDLEPVENITAMHQIDTGLDTLKVQNPNLSKTGENPNLLAEKIDEVENVRLVGDTMPISNSGPLNQLDIKALEKSLGLEYNNEDINVYSNIVTQDVIEEAKNLIENISLRFGISLDNLKPLELNDKNYDIEPRITPTSTRDGSIVAYQVDILGKRYTLVKTSYAIGSVASSNIYNNEYLAHPYMKLSSVFTKNGRFVGISTWYLTEPLELVNCAFRNYKISDIKVILRETILAMVSLEKSNGYIYDPDQFDVFVTRDPETDKISGIKFLDIGYIYKREKCTEKYKYDYQLRLKSILMDLIDKMIDCDGLFGFKGKIRWTKNNSLRMVATLNHDLSNFYIVLAGGCDRPVTNTSELLEHFFLLEGDVKIEDYENPKFTINVLSIDDTKNGYYYIIRNTPGNQYLN